MVISLNSNTASMKAQRTLAQSASELSSIFGRLSSGQRIVKASDDAAGLSVASSLNLASHVYAEGYRNLNDAVSMYNIADGAVGTMKDLLVRMRELSAQASNGTLAGVQRVALDKECQALTKEYNRIIDTTEYNGVALFSRGSTQVSFHAGYSELGLSFGVDDVVTTGAFAAPRYADLSPGGAVAQIKFLDFNQDGNLDMYGLQYLGGALEVALGNGDGSFRATATYGGSLSGIAAADMNGDGVPDLITQSGQSLQTYFGNGDGSFRYAVSQGISVGSTFSCISAADVNNDGNLDLTGLSYGAQRAYVFLGAGNGRYSQSSTSYYTSGNAAQAFFNDINLDGNSDLLSIDNSTNTMSVRLGNGDGTFASARAYSTPAGGTEMQLADVNGDGLVDLVTDGSAGVGTLLGNGDGSFAAARVAALGYGPKVAAADYNKDGLADVLVANQSGNFINVLFGNGDGSFRAAMSSYSYDPSLVTAADINNDGITDIADAGGGGPTWGVRLAAAATAVRSMSSSRIGVAAFSEISLRTAFDARQAQGKLDTLFSFVNKISGALGAAESRLSSASSLLQTMREQAASAESQITNADVAFESAGLVRQQILQQANSAVLAQVNQAPALALKLLS